MIAMLIVENSMNIVKETSSSSQPSVGPTLRELQQTVLQWSIDRIQATRALVVDMLLRWPELHAFEATHLKAAREALEKAAFELNHLK
jgi:hypothetical protein